MAANLAALRTRTLSAATRFHDYNFRVYFTQKVIDTFDAVAKKPEVEIEQWCSNQGELQLDQMERMAVLNRTYARTPVFLDPVLLEKKVADGVEGKSGNLMDSLPHGGAANRNLMPEEDEDEAQPEGK